MTVLCWYNAGQSGTRYDISVNFQEPTQPTQHRYYTQDKTSSLDLILISGESRD